MEVMLCLPQEDIVRKQMRNVTHGFFNKFSVKFLLCAEALLFQMSGL